MNLECSPFSRCIHSPNMSAFFFFFFFFFVMRRPFGVILTVLFFIARTRFFFLRFWIYLRPLTGPGACSHYCNFTVYFLEPLRKHSYSNTLQILQPKKENFQIKISDIFHIFSQNIDCGYSLEPPRRGGSNEYPQSMFFKKIRKIMYTPVNPSFTI